MKNERASGAFLILIMFFGVMTSAVLSAASPATVRLWNWNVHDKKYQQKMYKLFNERHPDIKIEYSSISNTVYMQTLEASLVAKEPPDLFMPSGKIDFAYLRGKGLLKPLNELAGSEAELKDWMAQFPATLWRFVEGVGVIGGKVYIVDTTGVMVSNPFPLFYNKTLFKSAGLDKAPATFSQMRNAAAKVTQAGQGTYFGATLGLRYPGTWSMALYASLTWSSGMYESADLMDLRDGKYHAGTPEFIRAISVWKGMREDGSVYPGETNMEDEAAKMAFATDKAAMIFAGWWGPGNVLAYNADCDFDVVLPPTPDDGINRGYVHVGAPVVPGGYVVSATTKNPKAVWEVIKFICSPEYQVGYVQGGYGTSYLPEANKKENYTVTQVYKFVQWGTDPALVRVEPVLSEGALKAMTLWSGIYPIYEDVLDNVYLGKSGFDALTDVDKRRDARLEAAIAKAQGMGIKVTRSDYAFPDWDLSKDYVQKAR